MKKSLALFSILFLVISCTKQPDNVLTKEIITLSSIDNVKTLIRDSKVQDSLDKIFLAKYLDYTPLTPFEIDSIAKNQKPSSAKSIAVIYGDWPEYTDYSGWIHLKVFYAYTTTELQHQFLSRDLPSDWVLVGGGAMTFDYDPINENGAFLTQSRPDPVTNYTSWIAASKDHSIPCTHNLYVFAIGMKITDYDPAELRSNICYIQSPLSSPASNLPTAQIYVPWDYQLIGGGAYDSNVGYGNMLIESYPNGPWWVVKGKAHKRSAPSQVQAYAIGIRNIQYPGVGYILTSYTSLITHTGESYPYHNYGPLWCDVPEITGTALTCPGGIVTYDGWGRMFMELWPSSLGSNDCYYNDSGTNQAYAMGIQKRPW